MSDFTITNAEASGNITVPQEIPVDGAVDIVVTLTTTGTVAFPATISAQITVKTETSIDYVSVAGPDVLSGAPIEITIPVVTTPVTQVGNKVSQNYLITLTDSDDRTQVINIATPEEFSSDSPNNPDGYPTVLAVGA